MSKLHTPTTFSWADEVEAAESLIVLSDQSSDEVEVNKKTLNPSFALEEDKYDINGRNNSAQERRQEKIAWSTVVRN